MHRIIVTPAGRKVYLEILFKYLLRDYTAGVFERWDLWLNTNVAADIEYCKSLAAQNPWIRVVVEPGINKVDITNICRFFKHACDPDAVYIRLDDDIVYVQEGALDRLFIYRVQNPEPFLVYGNIINNAIVSHLHQRNRLFQWPSLSGYACMDATGWKDGRFSEVVQRAFLRDLKDGQEGKWCTSFREWVLLDYERVSINCIAFLGSTFAAFGGKVGVDEEQWLSVDKPRSLKKPNVILGDCLVGHYAFGPQRAYLDKTDVLAIWGAQLP